MAICPSTHTTIESLVTILSRCAQWTLSQANVFALSVLLNIACGIRDIAVANLVSSARLEIFDKRNIIHRGEPRCQAIQGFLSELTDDSSGNGSDLLVRPQSRAD